MHHIPKGTTGYSVFLKILNSASTVGAGLTGLTNGTLGLTAFYTKTGITSTNISLYALSALTAGWTSGGFLQVDSVYMKGVYRFDVPDALFTEANESVVSFFGAANMVETDIGFQLQPVPADIKMYQGTTAATGNILGVPYVDIGYAKGITSTVANNNLSVDVQSWQGATAMTGTIPGSPASNLKYINGITAVSLTGVISANVVMWNGASAATNTVSGYPDVNLVYLRGLTALGQSGNINANVQMWMGATAATSYVAGVPYVDIGYIAGSAASVVTGNVNANILAWNGVTLPASYTAGYPIVTIKDGTGQGEIDTNLGRVSIVANGGVVS